MALMYRILGVNSQKGVRGAGDTGVPKEEAVHRLRQECLLSGQSGTVEQGLERNIDWRAEVTRTGISLYGKATRQLIAEVG